MAQVARIRWEPSPTKHCSWIQLKEQREFMGTPPGVSRQAGYPFKVEMELFFLDWSDSVAAHLRWGA